MSAPCRLCGKKSGLSDNYRTSSHMIVKGRNRDTAWFAMLDGEWPQVKARLEAAISR